MRHHLFTLFLTILSPCAIANNYLHITGNVIKFNYQEHSSTGEKLNKETGITRGVSASYSYNHYNMGFNLTAGHYSGNVDYQGKTQAGVPLNTTTDEDFTDLGAEIFWYPVSLNLGLYTSFQWLEWQRRILPSSQSIELNEVYQWQTFEAGFISPIFQYGKHQLELKFGLSHSKNGHLEVNLSEIGFGKPCLDLGDGSGTSTSLTYHFYLANMNRLSIGLAHKQWRFSQSDSKTVSNNTSAIIIREPKSNSKKTSIFLSYRFNLDHLTQFLR
jgi:hypothetical protein